MILASALSACARAVCASPGSHESGEWRRVIPLSWGGWELVSSQSISSHSALRVAAGSSQSTCARSKVKWAVFHISRDWSRSRIKSCNPKNQIWDNPEKKWYLSQSGCGIKTGINTTFLARNCGSALTAQPRRTTEPGVLGAWTLLIVKLY